MPQPSRVEAQEPRRQLAAHLGHWPGLVCAKGLGAFTRQRAELLAVLQPLPPKAWSRSATVTGAGRPLQRTVLSYAQWLANHEQSHLRHIARLVSTQHR